jgi:hypothetical protein
MPRTIYCVIISRKCLEMQRELATALQGRAGFVVMLDRRYGERRGEPRQIAAGGRPSDRRRILSLISTD